MNLSSNIQEETSHGFTCEGGEWVTRGFIALKPSRRKPASIGETGGRNCSKTRSFSVNLSTSIGTWKGNGIEFYFSLLCRSVTI